MEEGPTKAELRYEKYQILLGTPDYKLLGLEACLNCGREDRLVLSHYRAFFFIRCDCGTDGFMHKMLSHAVYLWNLGHQQNAKGEFLCQ